VGVAGRIRRNWGNRLVLPESMLPAETTSRPRHAWAPILAATCLFAALVAVIAPGNADSAPLRVAVLGKTAETPPPDCPGKVVNKVPVIPCRVEGHVTGFQVNADGIKNPYEAQFEGKVVAWSITLAKPSSKVTATTVDELGFFNELLGQPSEARISILRPVEGSKPPRYKLVRQSPTEVLNPYFGTTPIFALDQPLVVLKGQIVALTVPTWAPMFAFPVPGENAWRGSRIGGHCEEEKDIQNGRPQQGLGKDRPYGCYYTKSRLIYTATLVQKP
jgi:hypothetical protein